MPRREQWTEARNRCARPRTATTARVPICDPLYGWSPQEARGAPMAHLHLDLLLPMTHPESRRGTEPPCRRAGHIVAEARLCRMWEPWGGLLFFPWNPRTPLPQKAKTPIYELATPHLTAWSSSHDAWGKLAGTYCRAKSRLFWLQLQCQKRNRSRLDWHGKDHVCLNQLPTDSQRHCVPDTQLRTPWSESKTKDWVAFSRHVSEEP